MRLSTASGNRCHCSLYELIQILGNSETTPIQYEAGVFQWPKPCCICLKVGL